MPLTIITGAKKSGKTSYILNQLKFNKKSTVIVPEQTVFLYEKTILSNLSEEGIFSTDILSFKKLARKLLENDKDFNRLKLLDKDTKTLLTEKIILSGRDNLVAFKNAAGNPGFCEKISTQITEFKKYLIPFFSSIPLPPGRPITYSRKIMPSLFKYLISFVICTLGFSK